MRAQPPPTPQPPNPTRLWLNHPVSVLTLTCDAEGLGNRGETEADELLMEKSPTQMFVCGTHGLTTEEDNAA